MLSKSVYIICEIASAHCGNIKKLKKLIKCADETGADFVKLQIFSYLGLVAEENKAFVDLKKIEIDKNKWLEIIEYTSKFQIKLIIEPFDRESFELIKDNPSVDAYKIPTSDISDLDFVKKIKEQNKLVFAAIGGSKLYEIDNLFNIFEKNKKEQLVLMHGIQNFPTKIKDTSLNKIQELKNRYKARIGYADHIDGEDSKIALIVPAMAIAAGATIIEKHICLNRSKKEYDYYSSLNPDEFCTFVQNIRELEDALGNKDLNYLSENELLYRNKMKKFAVLNYNANQGNSLNDTDIVYRRTSEPGLTRSDILKLEKKNTQFSLPKGTILKRDHFEK